MCTVTYLPIGKNDFILTSSRDEKVTRVSMEPALYKIHGKKVLFPKDSKAGGTWIAQGDNRLVCLLNGAFQKHIPFPPYRKSRGLVVLDYFAFENITEFKNQYSFEKIEPFTLVVLEESMLYEFRWDGILAYLMPIDRDNPKIWSSSTLYTEEVIKKRETWFENWLSEQSLYSVGIIRHFHITGGDGDKENVFKMNRGDILKTISLSTVEKKGRDYFFTHDELKS